MVKRIVKKTHAQRKLVRGLVDFRRMSKCDMCDKIIGIHTGQAPGFVYCLECVMKVVKIQKRTYEENYKEIVDAYEKQEAGK